MAQTTRPKYKMAWLATLPLQNETSCNCGRLMSASEPEAASLAKAFEAVRVMSNKVTLLFVMQEEAAAPIFDFPALSFEKSGEGMDFNTVNDFNHRWTQINPDWGRKA